jgi:hypothetical protein
MPLLQSASAHVTLMVREPKFIYIVVPTDQRNEAQRTSFFSTLTDSFRGSCNQWKEFETRDVSVTSRSKLLEQGFLLVGSLVQKTCRLAAIATRGDRHVLIFGTGLFVGGQNRRHAKRILRLDGPDVEPGLLEYIFARTGAPLPRPDQPCESSWSSPPPLVRREGDGLRIGLIPSLFAFARSRPSTEHRSPFHSRGLMTHTNDGQSNVSPLSPSHATAKMCGARRAEP